MASVTRQSWVWVLAGAYFAAYVPYSALTKALSSGALPGLGPVPGAALLPAVTVASIVGATAFLAATGWWRRAASFSVAQLSLPRPSLPPLVSGIATAAIMASATLAFALDGVSIVFMMLLMRGGVLAIAPVIDVLTGRTLHTASRIGLALSGAALLLAVAGAGRYEIDGRAVAVLAVYLAAYFLRLRVMSGQAKTSDPEVTKRYFAEEQLVVGPATMVFLVLVALLHPGLLGDEVRSGFALDGARLVALAIGGLSQIVGITGTLIFLDPRENTFSVLVNRSTSVVAGVAASSAFACYAGGAGPGATELAGAALIVAAIVILGTAHGDRSPASSSAPVLAPVGVTR